MISGKWKYGSQGSMRSEEVGVSSRSFLVLEYYSHVQYMCVHIARTEAEKLCMKHDLYNVT
jgi:hypothetical protein